MTVTPDILREHVETDLGDDALTRLIDDAVAAIARRHGDAASVTKTFLPGFDATLYCDPPIGSLTSITESDGDTETVLSADDTRLLYGGRHIERLATGTHPADRWASRVTVAYVPVDDSARRDRVTIDLVRLALQYSALQSEGAGDYRATHLDYQRERDRLIAEVGPKWLLA